MRGDDMRPHTRPEADDGDRERRARRPDGDGRGSRDARPTSSRPPRTAREASRDSRDGSRDSTSRSSSRSTRPLRTESAERGRTEPAGTAEQRPSARTRGARKDADRAGFRRPAPAPEAGAGPAAADAPEKPASSPKAAGERASTAKPARSRTASLFAEGSAPDRFAKLMRRFFEQPYSREAVVGAGLGLAFTVMLGRLAYLQSFASGELGTTAKNERTARMVLPHRRGGIYDRNGNVLARSIDAVDIAVHPNLVVDVGETADVLAGVLGGDVSTYVEILSRDTTYAYVVQKADPAVAEQLKDRLAEANKERKEQGLKELGGFEYEDTSKRVYPMGSLAGNVVGCVGTDGHGLTGLELQYDDILSGTDGYLIQERGVYGSPVVGGQYERTDPIDGENIVVSIDLDIQRVAQEQLTAIIDEWHAGDGCVVVMQPRTGELLACCSTPYLDPGNFSTAEAAAFNLRCVSDSYEPGSTVKPLTASMAIDLGVATPDTSYYVPARIDVGDDSVGDSDGRDYDTTMTLTNILELSSNVGAVLVAESVGAGQFASYLERYQIGHRTGIDYPGEVQGLVSQLEDYTGAWQAMAFGQGLAVPPVQVARAIGAIANGGVLTTPHFLVSRGGEEVAYEEGDQTVTAETASQVAQMMYSVTENGYGRTGRVEGYHVSSKTGTAERVDSSTGRYIDGQYTVSFIGFGPTEDPRVLVYVLVDYVPNATGSEAVGSAWAVIMRNALEKLQIPPSS